MERLTGHADLQELLGAYALDAVDPDEAAAIERHLPTCPRCRNELADHREVAGLLSYAGGAAPSGLWDRIITSLEEPPPALLMTRTPAPTPAPSNRAAPPAAWSLGSGPSWDAPAPVDGGDASGIPPRWPYVGTVPEPPVLAPPPPIHARNPADNVVPISGRRQRTVPMRLMVAVATVAAVIVAALGIQLGRVGVRKSPQPATPNLLALAYRVADADPSARHLTLTSPDGAHTVRAVIIADGTTFLGSGNLDTLPKDETYQMWGVVDGARVSLGVIGNNPTYAAFTTPPVATLLAMTVEPRGGVVSSTKTPVIAGVVPA